MDFERLRLFAESAASRTATVSGIHIHHSLHRDNETSLVNRVEATDSLKSESNSFQNNHAASVARSIESKKQDKEYEDNVKNKILEASLNYVAEHGWTKAAIVAGMIDNKRALFQCLSGPKLHSLSYERLCLGKRLATCLFPLSLLDDFSYIWARDVPDLQFFQKKWRIFPGKWKTNRK